MRLQILSAALFVSAIPALCADQDIENKYPGYKLVFAEEFDKGDRPDPEIWSYEVGKKRNNEDQCYMEENATIKDGMLVIEARKERVKNPDYVKYSSDWRKKDKYCEYTSASIIAKKPYQYTYGVYEVRAKIPVGQGYWPAIWSTGCTYEWPYNGEIDMMEYYGDAIHANVAWGSSKRWNATWSSQAPRMSTFEPDFADKFHIWKMEWTEEAIKIYLDDRLLNETKLDRTVNPNPGEEWYNRDGYNPYRDPENTQGMWLNLALGGNNGGSLDNTPFPAQYLVDYVRIYTPDGPFSALKVKITELEKLLAETAEGEKPGQYTAGSRQALADAIGAAGKVVEAGDESGITDAVNALENARQDYLASVNRIEPGVKYRFRHMATGLMLSTGWHNDEAHVLILEDNTAEGVSLEGYNQVFSFEMAPEGAKADGYNMLTGDGNYVYRNSWNLFFSDTPKLTEKNWLFDVEFVKGKAIIKNLGSGKYFGNDTNEAWNYFYSDKAGEGNEKAYFEIIEADKSGVGEIEASVNDVAAAVYTLTGVKVAASVAELAARGARGVYIVVENGKGRKIVL